MASDVTTLRRLLDGTGFAVIAGVHDALSARIAKRAGFHSLWLSGLGMSLSHGVPDEGVLTMSEAMAVAHNVLLTSRLPIIVDCDTGYGDTPSGRRLALTCASLGIQGICVEDQRSPKRNSFDAADHTLESVRYFCSKIAAMKSIDDARAPLVIARLEALVQHRPMAEAVRRARTYEDAGADAIIVHVVEPAIEPIAEFIDTAHLGVPIGLIPTSLPGVRTSTLRELGLSFSIYANQALRASIVAMRNAYETTLDADGIIEDKVPMASMSETLSLTPTYSGLGARL